MSKRKVSLVIICEDKQQECFARRFLYGMGWGKDEKSIRVAVAPSGEGSAEQWVREAYARELKVHHRGLYAYAMVTIIDGDNIGVDGRIRQLDDQCIDQKIPVRRVTDEVAIIVPTRNIETWIHYLKEEDVDEINVYPKLKNESECQPAVAELVKMCKTEGLPDEAPFSLKAACEEFKQRIQ